MNNKIKEAAERKYPIEKGLPRRFCEIKYKQRDAFEEGAAFVLKEMEQLRDAAKAVTNNLERDDEPALMDNLRAALSATESFFETDKI